MKLSEQKESIKTAIFGCIEREFPEEEVAIMLSGGADSITLALAAHHLGKKIVAYTYRIVGYSNPDYQTARSVCDKMGWRFVGVNITLDDLPERFLDLFYDFECTLKTEAEVLFPMWAVIDHIVGDGFRKVLTGFGSPIPTSAQKGKKCDDNPEKFWSEMAIRVAMGEEESPATTKVIDYAKERKLHLVKALEQQEIIRQLHGLKRVDMIGAPYKKHHWKDCFYEDFRKLGLLHQENRYLQTGMSEVFSGLLKYPELSTQSTKDYKTTKKDIENQVKMLITRWGKNAATGIKRPKIKTLRAARKFPSSIIPWQYDLAYARSKSEGALFTVVSTFAGGGGSSLGYRLAGGNIKFINEFVDEAVETYRANFPETPIEHKNIRSLNHGKEDVEALFARYGVRKGELDILDGSPPCSPFSPAKGKKNNEKDSNASVAYSDTTQKRISTLIHDYVFMANVMQPKVCVFENVPGIAKPEKNSNTSVYSLATDRLRRHGYLVVGKVLNASNYGAPQHRERLITIAVRKDIAARAGIKDELSLFLDVFPLVTVDKPRTVRDALEGVAVDQEQREMLLTFARRGAEYELIKLLPHSPAMPCRVKDIKPDYTSNFLLTRASWECPSTTITATGAGGRGGVLHPDEDRVFTIPELRRVFGLPDDFKLTGTFDQKAERIGRMVPPALTMAVATSVYHRILAPSRS